MVLISIPPPRAVRCLLNIVDCLRLGVLAGIMEILPGKRHGRGRAVVVSGNILFGFPALRYGYPTASQESKDHTHLLPLLAARQLEAANMTEKGLFSQTNIRREQAIGSRQRIETSRSSDGSHLLSVDEP